MQPDPTRPKADRLTLPQQLPKVLAKPRRLAARPARPGRPAAGRAVVAVLGSVAALGGSAGSAAAAGASAPSRSGKPAAAARSARRADPMPAGEVALLGLVFAALTAGAPAIARPLLARGVASRTITEAEADAFLARLASTDETSEAAAAPAPAAVGAPAGAAVPDTFVAPTPAAVALFQTIFDAIRRQLPLIAKPLVADALAAQTITQPQARRIEQRLKLRAHLRSAPAFEGAGRSRPGALLGEPLLTGRLP